MLLKYQSDRLQVKLGGEIEHGKIFVVERLCLGGFGGLAFARLS